MNKFKVFIGIPAHNEEKNIGRLIDSILKQKASNFSIENIIVACDGCTDNTARIVNKYKIINKNILCLDDGKRIGQGGRLNELFTKCHSDIFVALDADTKLANSESLKNLITKFVNPEVGLVGGKNIPTKAITHLEKVLVNHEMFWRRVTSKINNGDNIHNCPGCFWATRKELLKEIIIPKKITASDHFIFLKIMSLGYKFKFASRAILYFKLPNNLQDYLSQSLRFSNSQLQIEDYFGDFCNSFYKIPLKTKVEAYVNTFLKNPLLTIQSIVLLLLLRAFRTFNPNRKYGSIWNTIYSSK